LEKELRRARIVLWTFRLTFYPCAVLVALVLIAARSTPAGGEPRAVNGDTSQGRTISLQIRDGRVTRFITQIDENCPQDRSYPYAWTADYIGPGGVRELFSRRWSDGVLGEVDLTMRARVEHGVVTGTLRMVEKRSDDYDCDSGEVTFTARAG
jgi:hypothetical protein